MLYTIKMNYETGRLSWESVPKWGRRKKEWDEKKVKQSGGQIKTHTHTTPYESQEEKIEKKDAEAIFEDGIAENFPRL